MTGQRLAWAWVAHLRSGGTTTWRDWRASGTEHPDSGPDDNRYLPGAQQLELLRRLNLEGRPSAALADRVIAASAPGRGMPDLQLVGAADESPFGPRPVEPTDLPDAELTRVATGLIAEDVVAAGAPDDAPRGHPRPWRTRYRLVGDSWLADPIRTELVRRGRPPGDRGATVYVLGTDLATMLVDAWTARSFAEGGAGWRDWLDPYTRSGRVPPRTDLVATAETWVGRVGRERVELVLDPALLPPLVGVRRPLPTPPVLSADAVDLVRGVGAALGLLVLPDLRAKLLRHTLAPRLARAPGRPLGVPEEHAEWVHRRAARMRDALLSAGYAVHGDPDLLVPAPEAMAAGADPADTGVLTVALRLLLEPQPRLVPPDNAENGEMREMEAR